MKLIVNGVEVNAPDGGSVTVSGGTVVVNGSTVSTYRDEVRVEVHGSCGTVRTVSGDVVVNGPVSGTVQTISGDVRCGAVSGSVQTISGDIIRG